MKVKSLQPEPWQTTYTPIPVACAVDIDVKPPVVERAKPTAGAVIKYILYPTQQQWVIIIKAFGQLRGHTTSV